MFIEFFYHLRERGLPVSTTEYLTLLEALEKGLHQDSLDHFYGLARSILVKKPEQYDVYDLAFAEFFKDATVDWSKFRDDLPDELLDWLKDPQAMRALTPEELAALEKLDLEELRRRFEERLNDQHERHDGGNKWIGTGGTSPFGHGGANPAGIRVGGPGGGRSAVQVAMNRRFKNLRSDAVLDVRQFSSALKRLRILAKDGRQEELDLDETIDETARNYGDIELVFKQPRKNEVKLLLLMDVGGSMTPYSHLSSLLFSAAHQASHFKQFESYYFHNCPYESVYSDMGRRKGIRTAELLKKVDSSWRCIIVGDAAMAPYELMDSGGSSDMFYINPEPGIVWLKRLVEKMPQSVWLNPDPPKYWRSYYTVNIISSIFPMFPLTLEGLDDAIRELRKKQG
ncbi:MAG: VWA domain-containing protein [bacterium]